MPFRVTLPLTFGQRLAASERAQVGMWVCSGSTTAAEICAGSGVDWLLIDGEHAPLSLASIQEQLRAVAAYPVTPVVRVPANDRVLIKQYLDLGAQNLLVPMVDTPEQAAEAVRAARYPPAGVRGVGSALARGARWNRVEDYLGRANNEHVSLTVQIESATAVANAEVIAATDGVDAVFIGPSDLAASMGLIGQQTHPEVVAAVGRAIEAARRAGTKVGINAFDPAVAHGYLDQGVDFILVGADVALLARQSEALAARFIDERAGRAAGQERASY
ncbi:MULTISPECIES: HpcH/HpaI aldolase family protein [Actinomyces]|uniref:HpcH/HpaI aldolase/citrate lyase family protein n=1 Tax=Actinomyces respiraculi TaxID=2744574 RepID=A0A7T0PVH7_9ACTO|nr:MULTISPECIES: HpcH/HpaI aldolase/citrate lyase family protein [Actinomyces]QPL04418.1 HpcH/HpaI aldolase/citrate lyase family protein [Actinomyces respiraculi]